ncbi:MAG: hypothetical protein EOO77_16130 [Oxalobacteraceae bacterium]|nr:MAG: hypothetical protein EOO77_16130 [Oxalobacteraceae bacterium]
MEARTRGPQAMRYGIFGFRPVLVARAMAVVGASLGADCPDSGGHDGFANADSAALLDVAAPLMTIGAGNIVSASTSPAK